MATKTGRETGEDSPEGSGTGSGLQSAEFSVSEPSATAMDDSPPKPDSSSKAARRFPRCSVDARLSVQVFRKSGTVSLWGRSHELGEDGVGGTLTGELEPGEVVSMELSLPLSAQPVKLRALVRYRSGLRHGFEFLALNPEQRSILRRVCEMLTSGEQR